MNNNLESILFSKFPDTDYKRILGIEHELGNIPKKGVRVIKFGYNITKPEYIVTDEHKYLGNGARFYSDCGHIEYCTPEVRDWLSLLVYDKAGDLIAPKLRKDLRLYKNNIDFNGHCYGSHENYFMRWGKLNKDSNRSKLAPIIPFLVTRQIFTGSGAYENGSFRLSQRSAYTTRIFSDSTSFSDKCFILTRDEPHASKDKYSDYIRLMLVLGDANMCEVAGFLKYGTTALVLELLEDNSDLKLKYQNPKDAVNDLRSISCQKEDWKVAGLSKYNIKATDVQRYYLDKVSKHFYGRDFLTNFTIELWDETLFRLDNNHESLVGWLDWITKKNLINSYSQRKEPKYQPEIIDANYHYLNQNKGLFYHLQNNGLIKRLITDDLIKYAVHNPPSNTRANLRGKVIKYLHGKYHNQNNDNEIAFYSIYSGNLINIGWEDLFIVGFDNKQNFGVRMTDPFETYDDKFDGFVRASSNLK